MGADATGCRGANEREDTDPTIRSEQVEASERSDTAGPRGLIAPYLVVIKAPAAAISDRENEQHCSAGAGGRAAAFGA